MRGRYVAGKVVAVTGDFLGGLPERPRRMVARLSRTDQAYLAVDQATRDAYHARSTK